MPDPQTATGRETTWRHSPLWTTVIRRMVAMRAMTRLALCNVRLPIDCSALVGYLDDARRLWDTAPVTCELGTAS